MPWEIKWKPVPYKFLENLQKDIEIRILNKLDDIKENPFHYLEHYEGNYYKIRIGDYRILIDMDFKNKIIIIEVLDKRGRVYK